MKKKKKVIVSLYVVTPILFLLSAVAFIAQCTIPFVDTSFPEEINYNHVIKDTYSSNEKFGNLNINEIAMLGSHDSCSYAITKNSPSNKNENVITNNDFVRPLARGLMQRVSKSQAHDIKTQFKAGARYYDFRITYISNQYMTCHSLISNSLEENIIQILECLKENPGEFVYINMQHVYFPKDQGYSYTNLRQYLSTIKVDNKSIYDYAYEFSGENTKKGMDQITYNELTNNGQNSAAILFIDDTENFKNTEPDEWQKYFVDYDNTEFGIFDNWANTMDDSKLIKTMQDTILASQNEEHKHKLKVNQAQKTPGGIDYVTSWSLLTISEQTNEMLLKEEKLIPNSLIYLPVYMTDFCTSTHNDFVNVIQNLIKKNNVNLANAKIKN